MTVQSINPWSGAVQYRYDYQGDDVVEATLARAAEAYPAWAALPLERRGEFVRAAGAALRARRDDIASTMTAEMGKLRREALAEVDKCAAACDYYADHAADYLRDEPIATEAVRSYVTYEPIGCVFAVMPWNFPIWQVFRFLAPALMAGNVAVLKHATNVPRCADAIAGVLQAAGLPEGVFGVLHIDNDMAAKVIADPRVKAVTLTGSERAGRSVAGNAGAHLKKCVMELGGSDPFVVLDDADLDLTVKMAVASRYGNSGQTCIAAKRFIVTAGVADEFVRRFSAAASALQVGNPADEGTTLAPMARADLRDDLHEQVVASIGAGARALIGCVPGAGPCEYRPRSSTTSAPACRPTTRSCSARSRASCAWPTTSRPYGSPTTPASAWAPASGPPTRPAARPWRGACRPAPASSTPSSAATCGCPSAAPRPPDSAVNWPSTASTSS